MSNKKMIPLEDNLPHKINPFRSRLDISQYRSTETCSFKLLVPSCLSDLPVNGFLNSRSGQKGGSVIGLVLYKTQHQEYTALSKQSSV